MRNKARAFSDRKRKIQSREKRWGDWRRAGNNGGGITRLATAREGKKGHAIDRNGGRGSGMGKKRVGKKIERN